MCGMRIIEIFDPDLASGAARFILHGDRGTFASDAEWATAQGAQIRRFNPTQHPDVFTDNPTVHLYVARSGEQALPLVLLNGEIALAGRYPTRGELARWGGIALEAQAPQEEAV